MGISNRLRIIALGSAIALPVGIYSCHKLNEKPAIESPVNEAIDAERKTLQMKEKDFVKKLDRWARRIDSMYSLFRKYEDIDDPFVELNFAGQKFRATITGHCEAIIPPENVLDEIVDRTKQVAKAILPPGREKNDFYVDPSKDQVEAFIKFIKMADKTVPHINLDDYCQKQKKILPVLNTSVAEGLKATEKEHMESTLRGFQIYQQMLDELRSKTPKLIQSIERFNEDAKKADQPSYEPVWGLSTEFLKSLKVIK